jgi:AraC-like DNA-binding protein
MPQACLPEIAIKALIDGVESEARIAAPDDRQRVWLPVPAPLGEAWLERLPLTDGLAVQRAVHRLGAGGDARPHALGRFRFDFGEPTWVIQTVSGGPVRHLERVPRAGFDFGPEQCCIRRATEIDASPSVGLGRTTEMTGLVATDAGLAALIGSDLAAALAERLGVARAPSVQVVPMPAALRAMLRATLSSAPPAPLQRLHAQARLLDYLCGLAAELGIAAPTPSTSRQMRERLHELHDYLLQLDGKVPALTELAPRFGLSASRMNSLFAREFGRPIHRYVAELRLDAAYHAIRDTDVPLKVLAARCGYSHVNHFSNAFARRFGHAPGWLRRHRPAGEDADPGGEA